MVERGVDELGRADAGRQRADPARPLARGDERSAALRNAYIAHVAAQLRNLGDAEADADAAAVRALAPTAVGRLP